MQYTSQQVIYGTAFLNTVLSAFKTVPGGPLIASAKVRLTTNASFVPTPTQTIAELAASEADYSGGKSRTFATTRAMGINVPPCISVMALLIASPNPSPPNCRVIRRSPCSKALKTRRQHIRFDSLAAVVTSAMTWPCPSRRQRISTHPPGGVNLIGVASAVPDHLLQPARHRLRPDIASCGPRSMPKSSFRASISAMQTPCGIAQDRAQFDRLLIQLDLASFKCASHIQQIIDQPRFQFHIHGSSPGSRACRHQSAGPPAAWKGRDHRHQRRAQLMRKHRQKMILGLVAVSAAPWPARH